MENIDKFECDIAPLTVSNKSKSEIESFVETLLNRCKIDTITLDDLQINILNFDDWLFYISVNKIEILDIKTGKFLDLEKLNEEFNLDFKNIYRGDSNGSFEDKYLDYDEFMEKFIDENGGSIGGANDSILDKIETIDSNTLNNNALVFYKKLLRQN